MSRRAQPIERLEGRVLLSAAIVHRTLRIIGTAQDDQIDLQTDGATTTVNLGHGQSRQFSNTDFDNISIDSGKGNDTVAISDDLLNPATIDGGEGDDSLKGGGGDDVLIAGLGNDTLAGGGTAHEPGGINTADYSARTEAITVRYYGNLTTASGEHDSFGLGSNIQRLFSGSGDDSLWTFANYPGDITYVDAGGGNDDVDMHVGGYVGSATAHGGAGNDYIYMTGSRIVYYGDEGDDTFSILRSEYMAREFFGGPGIDTVDYSPSGALPIQVSFDDIANDGYYLQYLPDNVHTDVERVIGPSSGITVIGSDNDETMIGNGGYDSLVGGGGNDYLESNDHNRYVAPRSTLIGGAGDDTVFGGDGNDLIHGGPGNDYIDCGAGDDTAFGDEGDDTLIGGAGSDVLDGGPGDNVIIDDFALQSPREITMAQLISELR
ncbi:MAG TPA: calcium-binding protein [Tepidisphaeraceae bacterium]|jgi:Ca2+-binding RTX toxin-like protein